MQLPDFPKQTKKVLCVFFDVAKEFKEFLAYLICVSMFF